MTRKPALYLTGSAKQAQNVTVEKESPVTATVMVADDRTPHLRIPPYDLVWLYADTEKNQRRVRMICQGYDLIKVLQERIERLRLALDPLSMDDASSVPKEKEE